MEDQQDNDPCSMITRHASSISPDSPSPAGPNHPPSSTLNHPPICTRLPGPRGQPLPQPRSIRLPLLLLFLFYTPAVSADLMEDAEAKYDFCTDSPSECHGLIGVCVVIGVLIIFTIWWFCFHKRHQRQRAEAQQQKDTEKKAAEVQNQAFEHGKRMQMAEHRTTILRAITGLEEGK